MNNTSLYCSNLFISLEIFFWLSSRSFAISPTDNGLSYFSNISITSLCPILNYLIYVNSFQMNLTRANAPNTIKKFTQLLVPYPMAPAIKIKITKILANPNILFK